MGGALWAHYDRESMPSTTRARALLVAGLLAAAGAAAPSPARASDSPDDDAWNVVDLTRFQNTHAQVLAGQASPLTVKVLFVPLADDDGKNPGTDGVTVGVLDSWLAQTNKIYATSKSNVTLVRDPRTSLAPIRSTAANNDCFLDASPSPFATPASVCKKNGLQAAAMSDIALRYPDAIVVFLRGGNWEPKKTDGKWTLVRTAGNWSSGAGSYVAFGPGNGGVQLGHEIGHYLHLAHTHRYMPKSTGEAERWLAARVEAGETPEQAYRSLFDGDYGRLVGDTAPDPSWDLVASANGAGACGPFFTPLELVFRAKEKTFRLNVAPPRTNVMAYYMTCNYDFVTTPGQAARMRVALLYANRRALVFPVVAKCAYDKGVAGELPPALSLQMKAAARQQKLDECLHPK